MQNTNTKIKIVITVLLLLVIILASLLLARIANDAAANAKMPYVIGSPVIPGSDMPAGMVMKTFNVLPSEPTPTISFNITPDTLGGYDVQVMTTNFTFTPEHLDGAPVPGEGHVHLYIDNDLIIMLGPWYHIDILTPGAHTIRVGLFNNDHSAYNANGANIQAVQQITVPGGSSAMKMMGM